MKRQIALFLPLLMLVLLMGCTDQPPVGPENALEGASLAKAGGGNGRDGEVKVMTWNIYVGADVDVVLGSRLEDIPLRVAEAYAMMQMTNFPERAAAIAREIKSEQPDLIGLQEVSLIRLIKPGVGVVETTDFLGILLQRIRALGLNYRLADSVQNIDITVPRVAGFDGNGDPILDFVQLVDADVILVRGDITTSSSVKGHYTAELPIEDIGLSVPRGYVSVAAKVGNTSYRFVNTHLEAFAEAVRLPQAMELAYIFSGETMPTIAVGDFNTDQGENSPYEDGTYLFLTGAGGFNDTWIHNLIGNSGPGYTFGNEPDLRNPYPEYTHRLDLILVRNAGKPAGLNDIGPVQADVVGDDLRDRTTSGLWPSDHAGVVARLHLGLSAPAVLQPATAEAVKY